MYAPRNELREEDIREAPSKYLLKLSDHLLALMLDGLGGEASVIYSQWSGYLVPGTSHHNLQAASLKNREGIAFKHIHTSGHATLEDLQYFVEGINPRVVIPIHTENKQEYLRVFPRVRVLDDGESYEISHVG